MKWLNRPEDAKKLIALIAYSLLLVVLGVYFGIRAGSLTGKIPAGYVAFDPKHMVCDVFSMEASGMQMVLENDQQHNRLALRKLVQRGRAEFQELETITCRQRDAKGLHDSIEFRLRQEWYVLKKLPARAVRSGD